MKGKLLVLVKKEHEGAFKKLNYSTLPTQALAVKECEDTNCLGVEMYTAFYLHFSVQQPPAQSLTLLSTHASISSFLLTCEAVAMAQVTGFFLPTLETQIQFLAPDFTFPEPSHCRRMGSKIADGISLSYYLSIVSASLCVSYCASLK